ncbi:Ras-related protein Rab2BV [Cucumispora dikerogammari]|nr:Ras-related protein Rab2BV [Cucumispora dikerogammari]
MEPHDYLYKIVLIGDSGVGKTNLLHRLIHTTYSSNLKATIGVEFGTKTYKINDKNIKLQIWDTAGQERYRAITSAYYRGAHGAFIVFDLNDRTTLDHAIREWNIQLMSSVVNSGLVVYLIGNKSDLKREVTDEKGRKEAQTENMKYFSTSAKLNEGVEDVFENIVTEIHKKNIDRIAKLKEEEEKHFNLDLFDRLYVKTKLKKKKKKKAGYYWFWCC